MKHPEIRNELCQQLDELLVQQLGSSFTVRRDSHGNYHFVTSKNHMICVKQKAFEQAYNFDVVH